MGRSRFVCEDRGFGPDEGDPGQGLESVGARPRMERRTTSTTQALPGAGRERGAPGRPGPVKLGGPTRGPSEGRRDRAEAEEGRGGGRVKDGGLSRADLPRPGH